MKTMKSFFVISLLLFSSTLINAQITANVYENPKIENIVRKHKSIAILPLDVEMKDTRRKKKRASQEELDDKALEYQKSFQNSMYSWFLKRQQKKKLVPIKIQDVDKTNALLKKNGIASIKDLDNFTRDEIASFLGVDAIFGGNVSTTATFSKGGAFALAFVTGISVSTGDADVFIKLWNGSDGEMIWSFDRTVGSSYASSTDRMVDYLMKRISKRFPYNK